MIKGGEQKADFLLVITKFLYKNFVQKFVEEQFFETK